jgi:hypothetical protein
MQEKVTGYRNRVLSGEPDSFVLDTLSQGHRNFKKFMDNSSGQPLRFGARRAGVLLPFMPSVPVPA